MHSIYASTSINEVQNNDSGHLKSLKSVIEQLLVSRCLRALFIKRFIWWAIISSQPWRIDNIFWWKQITLYAWFWKKKIKTIQQFRFSILLLISSTMELLRIAFSPLWSITSFTREQYGKKSPVSIDYTNYPTKGKELFNSCLWHVTFSLTFVMHTVLHTTPTKRPKKPNEHPKVLWNFALI